MAQASALINTGREWVIERERGEGEREGEIDRQGERDMKKLESGGESETKYMYEQSHA